MEQDKYILIISTESEKSTDDVLRYLIYYDKKFARVNDTDVATNVTTKFGANEETILNFKSASINMNDISAAWYRRGKIELTPTSINLLLSREQMELYSQYFKFYRKEEKYISDYIYDRLRSIRHINNFADNYINKLVQLSTARKVGLRVPETLITRSLAEVSKYLQHKKLIIKALDFPNFSINTTRGSTIYSTNHSVVLDKNNFIQAIKKYNSKAPLISFYQEYIEKKFEIRAFFLSGKIYSMAIFSQQNEKTKIDFRNYDFEKPNRNVPFELPNEIKDKINCLMAELKLNCGSLDILYSTNKEYYFLEVNPIGHFDWLSKACNYHIDKRIAQYLAHES